MLRWLDYRISYPWTLLLAIGVVIIVSEVIESLIGFVLVSILTIIGFVCGLRHISNLFIASFKSFGREQPVSSILDYNYKYCNTSFVGCESTMEDLDAFMTTDNTKSFLWYVVYGEAGAGKSRLALELCNKYKKRKWDCGFIDWDILSNNYNKNIVTIQSPYMNS